MSAWIAIVLAKPIVIAVGRSRSASASLLIGFAFAIAVALAIGAVADGVSRTAALLFASAIAIAVAAIAGYDSARGVVDHVESVVPGASSFVRLEIARVALDAERSIASLTFMTISSFADDDDDAGHEVWNSVAFAAFVTYWVLLREVIPKAFVAGEYTATRIARCLGLCLLAFSICALRPFSFALAFLMLECGCASLIAWRIFEGFNLGAERARMVAFAIPDARARVR